MPKHQRVWVVMADGGHAKIVTRGENDAGYVLVTEFDSADAHHLTRDLVPDRSGRSQESGYSGRHAIEPRTDPHELRKTQFIRMVSSHLNEREAKGDYDALILFAPPHCLHELRECLDKAAMRKVKHEAPQDLTKMPFAELSKHLEKLRWT